MAAVPALKPTEEASVPVSVLEARLNKIEALEARIAALELSLATPALIPFPAAPKPPRKLKWLASSEQHRTADLSPEIAAVLAHNLSLSDVCIITLHAALGSPDGLRRAEKLKQIFEHSGWTVTGPREVVVRPGDYGLSLAVGSLPLPPQAASAHLALTAAGFVFDSLLEPQLRGDETVLIVG